MTSLSTGTRQWVSIPVPDNGEQVVAVSATSPPPAGEGPVRPGFQALIDRTEWLLAVAMEQINLSLVGSARVYTTTDRVGCLALGALALWKDDTQAEIVLATMATAVAYATPPPTVGLYYFYLYWDALTNQVGLEINTIPPTGYALAYQTGHPSRRFIGAGYSYDPGGGAPLAWRGMRQERGHAVLDDSIELLPWTTGTAAWVMVSAANKVPPQVRTLDLQAEIGSKAIAAAVATRHGLKVTRHGSGGGGVLAALVGTVPMGEEGWGAASVTATLDELQQLDWYMPAPAAGNQLVAGLSITGWYL